MTGKPCQDRAAGFVRGALAGVVLCDGAGSCPHSERAAQRLMEWIPDYLQIAFDTLYALPPEKAAAAAAAAGQAALEVLAIIAYNQPVTKSFIEQIRGVDSSSVVNALVAKELVQEMGRLEIPGRPISYGTTEHFLRCFGMKSIETLPKLPQSTQNAQEGEQA